MISAGTVGHGLGRPQLTSWFFLLILPTPVLNRWFQGSPSLSQSPAPKLGRSKEKIEKRPGSGEDLQARDEGPTGAVT